jgi:hypothetical protein
MTFKKFAAAFVAATAFFSCSKMEQPNTAPAPSQNERSLSASISPAAPCTPGYYNLAWDGAGRGLIYKISGSPSTGAPIVTPIIGSAGNNIVGSSLAATTVFKMTGLAYDPATGVAWGVTGNGGSHPNSLIKFALANPNVVSIIPLVNACGIVLDVSDIERDPATGRYYAINRGLANPNNRVVVIDVNTAVVNCLPNFLNTGLTLRGLTFNCNAQLYVLYAINTGGRVLEISKVTGLMINAYSYPGIITPGGVGAPEMGLHFDCFCIGRFITGSLQGGPLLTDGLPFGLGGPLYASLPGVIKPTVDFAKP